VLLALSVPRVTGAVAPSIKVRARARRYGTSVSFYTQISFFSYTFAAYPWTRARAAPISSRGTSRSARFRARIPSRTIAIDLRRAEMTLSPAIFQF